MHFFLHLKIQILVFLLDGKLNLFLFSLFIKNFSVFSGVVDFIRCHSLCSWFCIVYILNTAQTFNSQWPDRGSGESLKKVGKSFRIHNQNKSGSLLPDRELLLLDDDRRLVEPRGDGPPPRPRSAAETFSLDISLARPAAAAPD